MLIMYFMRGIPHLSAKIVKIPIGLEKWCRLIYLCQKVTTMDFIPVEKLQVGDTIIEDWDKYVISEVIRKKGYFPPTINSSSRWAKCFEALKIHKVCLKTEEGDLFVYDVGDRFYYKDGSYIPEGIEYVYYNKKNR